MTDRIVLLVGGLASLVAAALWLWASLIKVPDNIDTFIGELQLIGRVNSWAAMAAVVAALCAAYGFLK